jgi:hypothetical protein
MMMNNSVSFGKNVKVQLHEHDKPNMELVQEKVAQLELTVSDFHLKFVIFSFLKKRS